MQIFKPSVPLKITEVDSHLLRGREPITPNEFSRIKEQGVTQIIDLRDNKLNPFLYLEKLFCRKNNIKYVNTGFSLNKDNIPDKPFFDMITNLIKGNEKGKTYIHCTYGLHRTGCGIAMYEQSLGKDEGEIVTNLIHEGYNQKKEMFSEKKKRSLNETLLSFIEKFFPKQTKKVQSSLNTVG